MTSKKVFINTNVMFAFIDRAHPKHTTAGAYFRYFALEQYQLFTDPQCVTDTYTLVYNKISPSLAKDYLRSISLSNLNVIYPTESDFKAALKALVTFKTTDLTFPEALIAVLANRNRITQICTFDYLHPLFGLGTFYLPI